MHNPPNYGSRWFRSIAVHLGESPAEYDDMESLFYAMLELADVELPWRKLVSKTQILESKQRATVEVNQFFFQTSFIKSREISRMFSVHFFPHRAFAVN